MVQALLNVSVCFGQCCSTSPLSGRWSMRDSYLCAEISSKQEERDDCFQIAGNFFLIYPCLGDALRIAIAYHEAFQSEASNRSRPLIPALAALPSFAGSLLNGTTYWTLPLARGCG